MMLRVQNLRTCVQSRPCLSLPLLLLVLPAIAAFALCVMLLQVLSPAVVHAQAAAPAVFR